MASACRDVVPARDSIIGFLALMPLAWRRLYVDGASRTLQLALPTGSNSVHLSVPVPAADGRPFRYQIPP
jgi:hypothetical protein